MYQRDFCTVERDERDFLVCQDGYYDIRFKPFGNTDSAECSADCRQKIIGSD